MELPLLLQFLIALFTGMVAATFVPYVRRSIPRAAEVLLWIALVSVCVVGVVNITDRNARELTASAAWGADQIIGTLATLVLGGLGGWISVHRFSIASWLLIVAGIDIFALVLIGSLRSARSWEPRVRLGEWMELPVLQPVPARRQMLMADPLADVNRRLAAASALAGAAVLAKMVEAWIWIRDVLLPRLAHRLTQAAAAGRVESRARLDSLSDATAHVQYAARAWYVSACEPAISGLAGKANDATVRTARALRRSLRPARLRAGEVVDIQALLSAQSIGWYGPLSAGPTAPPHEVEDVDESQPSDRLAS